MNNTEYVRQRYAVDPEFRARRREAGRRHYEKMMQDPVRAEQHRARMRECRWRRKLVAHQKLSAPDTRVTALDDDIGWLQYQCFPSHTVGVGSNK